MHTPFITIIIPIRNEEQYINKCIDSILQQDYPKDKIEILIIDGMSDDNTRTIITQYIRKFSYIKLLDNPNKVVPAALNIGIKKAQGEILIRIDGHCYIEPDFMWSIR